MTSKSMYTAERHSLVGWAKYLTLKPARFPCPPLRPRKSEALPGLYIMGEQGSGARRHGPPLEAERQEKIGKNQSPKGIMRSAVPLPCIFDVVKSQRIEE